ncbi:hypothetical protein L9F63_020289, partial [Diploptera punctata]
YLRLKMPESDVKMLMESNNHRHQCMDCFSHPKSRKDVINMLGDQTDKRYPIFREMSDSDYLITVAVGIFDCVGRTWSIYADNPKTNAPIVVLPMDVKSTSK